MSNTVQIRYRSYLPGSGFNGNGNPVQGKSRTVGRITVTTLNGGGESLTPSDVGLSVIDHIDLKVTEEVSSKSGAPRSAHYSYSAQEFYVLQDNSTTSTSGNNYVVTFVAEGDSSRNIESL